MRAPSHVLMVLLGLAFSVLALGCFQVFPRPALPTQGSQGPSFKVFPLNSLFSATVLDLGSGMASGARGWVAGRAGLWGVSSTWVWVIGTSPQILEHPTSICDTGINFILKVENAIFLTPRSARMVVSLCKQDISGTLKKHGQCIQYMQIGGTLFSSRWSTFSFASVTKNRTVVGQFFSTSTNISFHEKLLEPT